MGSISSLACSNAGINSGTRQQSEMRFAHSRNRSRETERERDTLSVDVSLVATIVRRL